MPRGVCPGARVYNMSNRNKDGLTYGEWYQKVEQCLFEHFLSMDELKHSTPVLDWRDGVSPNDACDTYMSEAGWVVGD